MTKPIHGGKRPGSGRHTEPGYAKTIKVRFLEANEEIRLKELTPRQRVEILLDWIKHKKD